MPLLASRGVAIDYSDEGHGPPVVLIHSSVSGNRQWRALTESLTDSYRVLAPNLYGYGATTPWPASAPQSLYAQAQIALALCETLDEPVRLVGHSYGGTVALKAATLLGSQVDALVLFEPNPIYLLRQAGRSEAFLEARDLRDHVKCYGALGDWSRVAETFADYWIGDGTWEAMPEKRRAAFAEALPPNFHEWDTVMDEETTVARFQALACRTLVVCDRGTRRPILEIAEILEQACPQWSFRQIDDGGHMAPLSRPDLFNPLVREFLDGG